MHAANTRPPIPKLNDHVNANHMGNEHNYRYIESMLCAEMSTVCLRSRYVSSSYGFHIPCIRPSFTSIGHTIDLRINRFHLAICLYNCDYYIGECAVVHVWHCSHQVSFGRRISLCQLKMLWKESVFNLTLLSSTWFFFHFDGVCVFDCCIARNPYNNTVESPAHTQCKSTRMTVYRIVYTRFPVKFKSHAYTFSGSQNSQIANHRANKQAKKAKASNEIEIEFAFREALLFIVVAAPKPRNEKK